MHSQDQPHNKPIVLGITGASGSILGLRLTRELLKLGQTVELVMTEKAYPVIFEELQLKVSGDEAEKTSAILAYLKLPDTFGKQLKVYGNHRLDAPPSSGTHLTHGMVIIPCSMGTLGRIAAGIGDNLVARAADVTLKEHRKLIIVPRESPLNQIHLKNLSTLAQCGTVIIPPMLAFYLPDFGSPESGSINGQINYTLGKVLDQLGFAHDLYQRWGEHTPS